jgi:hypothetical protein
MAKGVAGSLLIYPALALVFLSIFSAASAATLHPEIDFQSILGVTATLSEGHFLPPQSNASCTVVNPCLIRNLEDSDFLAGPMSSTSTEMLLAQTDSNSDNKQTVGVAPKEPNDEEPPAVARISDDVGGVLTRPGHLVIEPSLEYSHSSRHRVALEGFTIIPAISIGEIDIREVDRDAIIPAMTLRYGVINRLEAEVKVPYVFRDDSTRTRPINVSSVTDAVFTADGNGIGDVEFALHYQLNRGLGGWPYFVGNFRAKTPTGKGPFDVDLDPATGLQTELPTGSGFWALQPSLTVLYPSDPAVFFANASYLWNISDNVGDDIGEIDPGDAVGFNFGMGFGINQRASFSLGYDHTILEKTEQRGVDVIGSNADIGSFVVGFTHEVTSMSALNVSLNIGVTEDAPDIRMTLRLPLGFSLF